MILLAKDLLAFGIITIVLVCVAFYACLKAASDDDDRNGRD
jgi:hypothetical protein